MTNGLLVFQSDFGTSDGAVSAMHGVALTVNRSLQLFEVTYQIPQYDIWEASFRLLQTITYWPAGTVFVSIVDPGVGSTRNGIVAKTKNGHYIITPDNGTLTHLNHFTEVTEVRIIDESQNRLPNSGESHTFHGRDIFAYTGARLSSGVITFEDIGSKLEPANLIILPVPDAVLENGTIKGMIAITDRPFGNLWTNISRTQFNEIHALPGQLFEVTILKNGRIIYKNVLNYGRSFADMTIGEPLIYINSLDAIGIAINQGSFAEAFNIRSGSNWEVSIKNALK